MVSNGWWDWGKTHRTPYHGLLGYDRVLRMKAVHVSQNTDSYLPNCTIFYVGNFSQAFHATVKLYTRYTPNAR
jgi:hypothetical protein